MALLVPNPMNRILDANGNPAPGGKAYFYETGTTTPATIYADAGFTTPLANPVVADGGGLLSDIYLSPSSTYRLKITQSDGTLIKDIDPFTPSPTSAGDLGFVQTGTGALRRVAQDKIRERVSFEDYGAVGTGQVDDAPAIRQAIAANPGKTIRGRGIYLLGSSLGEIPENTRLQMDGRRGARLLRGYNGGYLMTLRDGAELVGVCIDGNGTFGDYTGGFTGGLVEIPVGHGNQSIHDCRLINAVGGTPLHIRCTGATDAQVGGSRMDIRNLEAWRPDSTPNSGRYAIVHDDPGVPAAGHPISIQHLETGGWEAIDLGACNDLFLSHSATGGVKWSDNSRGVHIDASRLAAPPDETNYTVKGTGAYSSVWFSRPVVVASGALALFDPSCVYNNGLVDNSGVAGACHYYDALAVPFAPNWKGGATAINTGADGLAQGFARREGAFINITTRLIANGAGAAVPSGALTFSVPMAADENISPQTAFTGMVTLSDGVTRHPVAGRIAGGQSTVTLTTMDGSPLTGTRFSTVAPFTIEISGRYAV